MDGLLADAFARKGSLAWLLIFGKLPSAHEYTRFSAQLTGNANIDESMKHNFQGFPRAAPPMAILSAMINALSCFHPELHELEGPDQLEAAAANLISKVRTIAAYAYQEILDLGADVSAVGHRVVHAGEKYSGSVVITQDVIQGLVGHEHHAATRGYRTVRQPGGDDLDAFTRVSGFDFLAVADHSDGMGMVADVIAGTPNIMADESGRMFHEAFAKGGEEAARAALELDHPAVAADQFLRHIQDSQLETSLTTLRAQHAPDDRSQ